MGDGPDLSLLPALLVYGPVLGRTPPAAAMNNFSQVHRICSSPLKIFLLGAHARTVALHYVLRLHRSRRPRHPRHPRRPRRPRHPRHPRHPRARRPDRLSLAGLSRHPKVDGSTLRPGTMRGTSSRAAARRRSHRQIAQHRGEWAASPCPGPHVQSPHQESELRSCRHCAPP